MKTEQYPSVNEVLAENTPDNMLTKVMEDAAQDLSAHLALSSVAMKYYDLFKLKKDILNDVAGYNLADLEFEPGRYELAVDFLGTLETAARTFGLEEVGIQEDGDSYTLGDQTAKSVEELEMAEEAVMEYAETVAKDINERIGLPGVFYFGYNSDFGDGAIRLFFVFDKDALYELKRLGSPIEGLEEVQASSFSQIIAVLENEGCHEMARKLHDIIRGQ